MGAVRSRNGNVRLEAERPASGLRGAGGLDRRPPENRHAPGNARRVERRPCGETCRGEEPDAGQGPQRKGRPGCMAAHCLLCPGLGPSLRRRAGLVWTEGPAHPHPAPSKSKTSLGLPAALHAHAKALERAVQLVPMHLWTLALACPGHTEARSQEAAPAESVCDISCD